VFSTAYLLHLVGRSGADHLPVNEQRAVRVRDLIFEFKNIQHHIAAAPAQPANPQDCFTEGWEVMRQCRMDGQHILNVAADTRVPQALGGPAEQVKAELQQYAPETCSYPAESIETEVLLGFTSTHMRDDTRLRRFIFVRALRSDGWDSAMPF
jgi:hypothetical protein